MNARPALLRFRPLRRLALGVAATLAHLGAVAANPVAGDWVNPPLALVSAQVELTVGREMTMVSSTYVFHYDTGSAAAEPRLYIHYPLYVEAGLTDWREIVKASAIKLEIGPATYEPSTGGLLEADALSKFPVPEDAAVAYLVFELPRELAARPIEARITHLQPNFRYHGAQLAAFTPWLPKIVEFAKLLRLEDHRFEVTLRAMDGVTFRPYTQSGRVLRNSPTELVVVPEHRKTIAVELPPAGAHQP